MNELTQFELKVLALIEKHYAIPAGNKSIQYASVARRLEKRGYCCKSTLWYLTDKGKIALNAFRNIDS